MFNLDRWQEIFQSFRKNKLRTILSGVTVSFAILLFTLLFGVASGLKNTFNQSFVDDANNSIFIYSGKTTKPYRGLQSGRYVQFSNDDYNTIKKDYKDKVQLLTSRIYKNTRATYKGKQNNYNLRAVHPDHQFLEKSMINEGRYINISDLEEYRKVIVIGNLVKEDLFGNKRAIGKNIVLNGIAFKVVGIYTDDGGDNEERIIYMPVSTAQKIYGNNDYIDQINLGYNPALNLKEAIDFGNQLLKFFKDKHDVHPRDQGAIRVNNLAESTQQVNTFMMVLNVIILFIGIGTLIAGIIGISNIMIYIVKERTKELGIRKAIGASPKSIINMIIAESIVITTVAGYLGLVLGLFIINSESVQKILEKYFIINPSVEFYVVLNATIVLVIAGTIAGYVPAKKASKIRPIEALNQK